MTSERELALAAKAWPFEEARKLLARTNGKTPDKGYVLFETGYGPSGLPHIGTFGEVARTTMVRQAFQRLSDIPTRLFAFSDDMDGLRKVPDNVPNQDMLRQHLGKPLTAVPDPFGTHDSFGAHNNARLRAFLDRFGFEYEFQSATEWYRVGPLRCHAAVDAAPLREGAGDHAADPGRGAAAELFRLPAGLPQDRQGAAGAGGEDRCRRPAPSSIATRTASLVETPVTGGNVKLQWKADWARRWVALGVDYEMYGKDLIPSAELSAKIERILGGTPPDGFNYELFLDDKGQKISKSKGNGISIDEWLTYGPPESLSLFMFQQPRRAKRLFFDVIPRAVDDYLGLLEKFPAEEPAKQLDNPVWHIHDGKPPAQPIPITFGMLLNLAGVANTEDKNVLWGFITRYAPGASPQTSPFLDQLVGYACNYYRDFYKAQKKFRLPTAEERAQFEDLAKTIRAQQAGCDGRVHPERDLRMRQAAPAAGRVAPVFPVALRSSAGHHARPAHGRFHQALRHLKTLRL